MGLCLQRSSNKHIHDQINDDDDDDDEGLLKTYGTWTSNESGY